MPFRFSDIRIPHVFIFLSSLILVCSILSYIVPSGKYERKIVSINGMDRTVVIPGSYKQIQKNYSIKGFLLGEDIPERSTPISVFGVFMAIPKGLSSAAELIFFVFFIGAVFMLIQDTGSINAIIYKLLNKFSHRPYLLSGIIFTSVALAATFLGMGTEFIPLIPLFLIISKELGFDRLYGLSFLVLAEGIGWSTAITNPFNVQIAQTLAEVPIGSGIWFRAIYFVVCLAIGFVYLIRYGKKIKLDPSKKIMPDDKFELNTNLQKVAITRRHIGILTSFILLFLFILYSVQRNGWGLMEMTGGFFIIGLTTILISGMSGDQAMKSLIKGLEFMIVPALIVGFARGIQVVMEEGMIIDTILHYASVSLMSMPQIMAAEGMFVFQTLLNFFIPSASGQALVSMPLMIPLGDLLFLTRQTTVFAYTIGDGWSNLIIPTNGVLMAMLGIANVPFEKWLKFVIPVFLVLYLVGAIMLALAVLIGY